MRGATWCGLGCAAVHIVLHSGWSCERQPHPPPAPCRTYIPAPPSAAREMRELEVRELWHAGPRSPAARSSRRSTRAAACHGGERYCQGAPSPFGWHGLLRELPS